MKVFIENIISIYGNKGLEWLDNLPKLVNKLAIEYGLTGLNHVSNLSYNYVLSGFKGAQPIVLKLGLDVEAFKLEALALKAFAGFGTVKLLEQQDGILLLERAIPGASLKSYFPGKDLEATKITCNVIKKLHQALIPKQGFPHIKDWLTKLDEHWNIPSKYLKKARMLRDKLLQNPTRDVLLHGDLHQDNIIKNGEAWLVIDPKGIIGEPEFEVAAFIRNPIPELLNLANYNDIIENRIDCFSKELQLERWRILDWCFVQAVLAWTWSLEDGIAHTYFEKLTKFFGERYIDA